MIRWPPRTRRATAPPSDDAARDPRSWRAPLVIGGAGSLVAGATVALGPAWVSPTLEAIAYLAGGACALAVGLAGADRSGSVRPRPPRSDSRSSSPRLLSPTRTRRASGLPRSAAPTRATSGAAALPSSLPSFDGPGDELWRRQQEESERLILPEIIGPVPETAYTPSADNGPFADRAPELILGLGEEEARSTPQRDPPPSRATLDGRPRFDLAEFLHSPLAMEALTATPPHLRHLPHSPHRQNAQGPDSRPAPSATVTTFVPEGARRQALPSNASASGTAGDVDPVWTPGGPVDARSTPPPMSHRAVLLAYEPSHHVLPTAPAHAACPCRVHYPGPRHSA